MPKIYINHNSLYILLLVAILLICLLVYIENKKTLNLLESFSNNTCVIYKFHKSVGFFSNFFFLCEFYILAKREGYDFYIDSSEWSYKYKDGWHDYFDSLAEINNDIRAKYTNVIVGEHGGVSRDVYENPKKQINTDPVYINDYAKAISEIFKPNETIRSRVDLYMKKYNNYDSIYIRRGDKLTWNETKYIEAGDIIKQTKLNSKTLYVQTDDYIEVETIRKLLPEKNIETITPENQRGSKESDRDSFTPEDKKKNTEDFLIGVIICSNASICWVDILSNVSRFIKLYGKNVHFYKIADETINFDLNKQTINLAFEASFM